jgi:hypothetical protein
MRIQLNENKNAASDDSANTAPANRDVQTVVQ